MKRGITLTWIVLLVASTSVLAQTWNGSVSNDWNTAGNWTPVGVPVAASAVTISNAAAPNQPVLAGNVNIGSLTMSAGILNLNGFTITCTGNAIFTGDSLLNGKVVANEFVNVQNMRMGGKITLDKTGVGDNFWGGNNKVYTDSLIVVWTSGSLFLENGSPDSIFSSFKIQLLSNAALGIAWGSNLFVQNNLVIDNSGLGYIEFGSGASSNTVINGSLVGLNFTGNTNNLYLRKIIALGTEANGPFYCNTGDINNSSFKGDFTLIADSSQVLNISNSWFLGNNNLFQAGHFDALSGCLFGQAGSGTTTLRIANKTANSWQMTEGNNKFFGNVVFDANATGAGGSAAVIQNTISGQDSCFGNVTYLLKDNSALLSNFSGNSYVAGNVLFDGQGANRSIDFGTGNISSTYTVGGNFTAQNFAPGLFPVNLHRVRAMGTGSCGQFNGYNGSILNSNFNGDFTFLVDSAQSLSIQGSSFLGNNNLFQAGMYLALSGNLFGQTGTGTTTLRIANKTFNVWSMEEGNNKFFGNVVFDAIATGTGGSGVVIHNTISGQDSCFGNVTYLLKDNSALLSSFAGNSYVAGNVIIDAQGAGRWVDFGTGNISSTYTVIGNFTAQNFAPGLAPVYLHRVRVLGAGSCQFNGYNGSIVNSSFNGDFTYLADSSQVLNIQGSSFLGNNNLFQAGRYDVLSGNLFGQTGLGTTTLRIANKTLNNWQMAEGNNKFLGNLVFEANATGPSGTAAVIQNTISGQDSCFGNVTYLLKDNSAVLSNFAGNSYVAGNVIIDGQGANRWIDFGTSNGSSTYTVQGNFTAQNFAPGLAQVNLHRVRALGTGSCGQFNGYTGWIENSSFNGDFTLLVDSAQSLNLRGSWFLGNNNRFEAGRYDVLSGNLFGQTGNGTTTLRMANKTNNLWLMPEGNNKFFGNVLFDIYSVSVAGSGAILQQSIAGIDSCFGNLTVNQSGITGTTLATNYNLYLAKGLALNNNSPVNSIIHNNPATAIRFIGTDTADYSFGGSGTPPSFVNIEMNRKGGLRLQSPLTYSGTLGFTRGIILSSLANSLTIPNGASTIGAWDSSYVDGPVNKIGNSAFEFPLGKKNVFAPISITAPPVATDAFTAQYFNSNANDAGFDSSQSDITIDHISKTEYWLLNRTNGTATPKVTLSWKSGRSGIIDVMSDLRVVRWNGTTWKDEGNGAMTGTNSQGTIQSLNDISSFGPFTLASSTSNNPLPVTFIYFNASLRSKNSVLVQWKTVLEINNDHFEVERSTDGRNWSKLAVVYPQATHSYEYTDNTVVVGIYYYRVKQIDLDGKYRYTSTKSIRVTGDNKFLIWPNPASEYLFVQSPWLSASIEITDANGRTVYKRILSNSISSIPVGNLAQGAYLVTIRNKSDVYTERFIKQ